MKSDLKVKRLLENWPAKIICFVLALMIYLFYRMSTLDVRHVAVPLSVREEGAVAVMSEIPRYVKVTFRGRTEDLAQISESEIAVFLNTLYYPEPGTYDIPVTVQLSGAASLMTPLEFSVMPQKVPVTLEERITGFVPVKPEFTGSPLHGYVLGAISLAPQYVRISGPKTAVEHTQRIITRPVMLDGADRNATVHMQLLNTNSLISLDETKAVSVSYEIVQNMITRDFSGDDVFFARVPDGLQITAGAAEFSLQLAGPQLVLENYTLPEGAVRADCSFISKPGVYDLPLEVFLPSDIKMNSFSPQTITVTASVRDISVPANPVPAEEPAEKAELL